MRLRDYPAALELVPRRRNDDPPPYLIAGGLLLRELDVNYLRTWGKDWSSTAPLGLLARFNALQEAQTPERRRFVVLTGVFPSEYTLGYQDVQDAVVEIVNGRAVDGIDDVVEALRAPQDGYHVFVLAPDDASREIVLDAAALESETARILEDYRIPEAVRLAAAPPPPLGPACPGDF
jgi:hypothetical protein